MAYLKAKKSLGQHFLKNPAIAERIVDAGGVKKGQNVLEIGPGTGALTRILLEKGARVIAIEADQRAIEILEGEFKEEIASKSLILIHKDIREMTVEDIPIRTPYKLIANIPYYITGELFRSFLESGKQPETLVFLVQKEVAERIARAEKESLLSLSVKAFGTPKYIETVKKGNFSPMPSVDSAILAVLDISRNKFKKLDSTWFFTVLKAGFAARRKQLVNNLRSIASHDAIEQAFVKLSLSPHVRGEDLDIEIWIKLAQLLPVSTKGKNAEN